MPVVAHHLTPRLVSGDNSRTRILCALPILLMFANATNTAVSIDVISHGYLLAQREPCYMLGTPTVLDLPGLFCDLQ